MRKTLTLISLLSLAGCTQTYHGLPLWAPTDVEVCSKEECNPASNAGTPIRLYEQPIRVEVELPGTVAANYLGRLTQITDAGLLTPELCTSESLHYRVGKTVESRLDVSQIVDIDIENHVQGDMGKLVSGIPDLRGHEAALEVSLVAVYKRVKSITIRVQANYYELSLEADEVERLKNGDAAYLECSRKMSEGYSMITSIGILQYKASANEVLEHLIKAEFSRLSDLDPQVLAAAISSTVNIVEGRALGQSIGPSMYVISWQQRAGAQL